MPGPLRGYAALRLSFQEAFVSRSQLVEWVVTPTLTLPFFLEVAVDDSKGRCSQEQPETCRQCVVAAGMFQAALEDINNVSEIDREVMTTQSKDMTRND